MYICAENRFEFDSLSLYEKYVFCISLYFVLNKIDEHSRKPEMNPFEKKLTIK